MFNIIHRLQQQYTDGAADKMSHRQTTKTIQYRSHCDQFDDEKYQ